MTVTGVVPSMNGGTHTYRPRGACDRLWDHEDDEVLISGPAGTGKSRACLERLNQLALQYPRMRGLIVRKTLSSLGSSALVTWRRDVVPELLAAGEVVFYGGSAEEPPQYRYRNGSRVVIGGLDKATKIMSTEYDLIYVQEAIELTEDDWESLTTRLRSGVLHFQQLLADCNPSTPTHWLNVRCNNGKTVRLESRHEDNPVLFDSGGQITPRGESYIAKLESLSGVRHARLRRGLWVAAEGVIYEEWEPASHLIDPFEIPPQWRRWWSVDFGFSNPFVLHIWAEDDGGRLYLVREVYHTRRLVEDHCRTILRAGWIKRRPVSIVCDHDAEGRATFEKHLGVTTEPAKKAVTEGIQAVQSRLKAGRLFILRDALWERDQSLVDAHLPASTVEEIPGYVWLNSKTKEAPVKEDDHGMDAMRYMVMHRDFGGRPNIRWLG
jgi:phage terminase large subunit